MRKDLAPSSPKPMKACAISKTRASNPPQKIAAKGRGGGEPFVVGAPAREEVLVIMTLSFSGRLNVKKDTIFWPVLMAGNSFRG
jgi:hypothetical protein